MSRLVSRYRNGMLVSSNSFSLAVNLSKVKPSRVTTYKVFWREWRGSNSQHSGLESDGNTYMPSLPHGASDRPRTGKRRILRTAGMPIPFTLAIWSARSVLNRQAIRFEPMRYAFPSRAGNWWIPSDSNGERLLRRTGFTIRCSQPYLPGIRGREPGSRTP